MEFIQESRATFMRILIRLTFRPTDYLRVLCVFARAFMFNVVNHSLGTYVTYAVWVLLTQFQRIFVPIQRKKFWGVFKKKRKTF